MKAKRSIAGQLWGAVKAIAYLAAGVGLFLTSGQAARLSAQTTRSQTQSSEAPPGANRDDKTRTDSPTASQPKTGLRAALGIRLSNDEPVAAILQTVQESSLAARAGLRAGDQILAVNGVRVNSADEFVAMLHRHDWRQDFRILIDRQGHARQLVVRGGTLKASPTAARRQAQAAIGVVLSQENPVRGVRVSEIYPGSPADEAGMRSGDIIMAVNGKRVTSPEELRSVILQHRPGDELDLSVSRQGWRRNFLLISIEQSDLAKLPAPQVEKPSGIVPPAPTAPAVAAPPIVVPAYPSGPPPGHTFGEVGGPGVQPLQTDTAPRDSWGNIYDPNRRALYTDFD